MAALSVPVALSAEELAYADRMIAARTGQPGALLGILEAIQEHHPHKYLSSEILEYVAEKTDIPLAQIYSVVTFFALFNLEPQGKHSICICRGTACHTRGSRSLLQRLRHEAGARRGKRRRRERPASPRRTAAIRCARWPASASARWRRWWRWTTPFSAT